MQHHYIIVASSIPQQIMAASAPVASPFVHRYVSKKGERQRRTFDRAPRPGTVFEYGPCRARPNFRWFCVTNVSIRVCW